MLGEQHEGRVAGLSPNRSTIAHESVFAHGRACGIRHRNVHEADRCLAVRVGPSHARRGYANISRMPVDGRGRPHPFGHRRSDLGVHRPVCIE